MHSLSVRRWSTSRGLESPPMQNTDGAPRSGLSGKLHAVVDTNGLPMRLALTTGKALDSCLVTRVVGRP